ncbi:response regulator [Variovorax sp. NFACC27]|jgi:two-component system response regulator BaeR|uniref:Response regulator n=1 Tax=Variovorax gossypii TaxID=1679495 RepID=A0A431TDI7_9BURK|nr:response regulator [Variovorax gossypii]SEF32980.1 two-component system, OmpR family, response regulator BaeR [Variovorax sp. NFACC28]SEG95513.1 two-component system, OmpR family, response regulator BaeR [Variovorax sp. NFACC29]SFD77668.1 two-component system, OmpR family, response regulator BaeR [Variovorax sp. NFACC26]SFG92173.1 two-component system, OmpR family, response regulator BaeR [Variovorax sp. NFACC27]RTQ30910.1 response regulator [Variovorax gossypii]
MTTATTNDTPAATAHILIVEDEPRMAALLADYLRASGYTSQWIANGLEAVPSVKARRPDLVLLDVMLPGQDGMSVCRELRQFSEVPVIMLTARVEEADRLMGLEIGADDYICKTPFSPREVVARVKALLRRSGYAAREASPLQIDAQAYKAAWQGTPLDLTPVEFRLLKALADARGRVLSRDRLLDHVHADQRAVTDRAVDSHVKNLRRKLDAASGGQELIRSIYGVGYRLDLP